MMTALAIGIHNFPEGGLATFVATLDDPAVGASLAIAIAIHNIPEGLCVSIPIYFATGDRWKAFRWALLSGVSEIVGALLGWALLKDHFDNLLYGIVFGMVAGMMIMICLNELIPTAHRYDPRDRVVTKSIVAGMAVMAASLCLFVTADRPPPCCKRVTRACCFVFVVASTACWRRWAEFGGSSTVRRRRALSRWHPGWTWAPPLRACYPQSIFPLLLFVVVRAQGIGPSGASGAALAAKQAETAKVVEEDTRVHICVAHEIRSQYAKARAQHSRTHAEAALARNEPKSAP